MLERILSRDNLNRAWKRVKENEGGPGVDGITIVLDRLIQQAISRVFQPIFDPEFSESSYGFCPKLSARAAVTRDQAITDSGFRHVVAIDIAKYFDNVNHDLLMARKVRDKRVLKLIGRYLRAGVFVDGKIELTTKGVPQGGPL